MMFAAGVVRHVNFLEIIRHPWFISAFLAPLGAQFIKMLVAFFRSRRQGLKSTFRELVSAGGMPSAHASLVSALAMAVGITDGFDRPYAMIAAGLGLIVLIDAATLRREAGEHAKLLNRIVEHLNGLPMADRLEARRLRERLGHRRREVFAGVVWGCFVAAVVCAIWDFWK